jgi:DNA-binding transcriptional ArsR family regulator
MRGSAELRAQVRAQGRTQAPLFAALGDATRLTLIARLAPGEACSISELTASTKLTRQAVTKHLRVLERADLVRSRRTGRENRFVLNPDPIDALKIYLDRISAQWDAALHRLRDFVER